MTGADLETSAAGACPLGFELVDPLDLELPLPADPQAYVAGLEGGAGDLIPAATADPAVGLLFSGDRADETDRVVRVRTSLARPLWLVGDLHGDLLGLEAALTYVRVLDPLPGRQVVFLGDFFDDGSHGAHVLVRTLEVMQDPEWAVGLVVGNHDEALRETESGFASDVVPSEFKDWLNADARPAWAVELGRWAIRLFEAAPRALAVPGGLWVAHGGIPLADRLPYLASSGDWNDPGILEDLVWTRAHGRASRKIPNRIGRGSQFGRLDFADFIAVADGLGVEVRGMVRGHDHVDDRWEVHTRHTPAPVVTVNTLAHRLGREVLGPWDRRPCVVRWTGVSPLEVHRLPVTADMVTRWYPEPVAQGAAD